MTAANEPNDFDDDFEGITSGFSPDFRSELAERLAELAPEVVADGKIDVAKLQELLGEDAGDAAERFGLFWPGKRRALSAAQAPTSATLRPDQDASKDWDTTQNVFIEGDNLEVLKVLQKHYHNKVKMIYIDPPYNTGKDFVYPDNFQEGLDSYLEWTKQVNEEGKKLSSNSETEGRYHSNWLNMMYPRLKLARNLLTDDGVIFISIDDNEVDNLKKLCNEVFGEANFLGQLIWFYEGVNDNQDEIKKTHEYLLVYSRGPMAKFNRAARDINVVLPDEIENSVVKNGPKNPPRPVVIPAGFPSELTEGKLEATGIGAIDFSEDIEVSAGVTRNSVTATSGWSSPGILEAFIANSFQPVLDSKGQETRFLLKKSGNIHYLKGRDQSYVISVLRNYGTTMQASVLLRDLLGGAYFSYPKPVGLIRFLGTMLLGSTDICLDFFAGSATTAHAVMALNAEDGGSRRFVMVQLPEPTPEDSEARKAGYSTIAEISRERIRCAGDAIVAEQAAQLGERATPLDVGFRAFKLSDSNFVKWRVPNDVQPGALGEHLLSLRGSADDDASPEDLLTEVLLKQGYSLTESISLVDISGLSAYSVGDGTVLAYLNEHVKPSLDQLRALAETGPARLIVLEDAYQGDDELKTNLEQICRSKNIELWRA